jgi:hypothetical protein
VGKDGPLTPSQHLALIRWLHETGRADEAKREEKRYQAAERERHRQKFSSTTSVVGLAIEVNLLE